MITSSFHMEIIRSATIHCNCTASVRLRRRHLCIPAFVSVLDYMILHRCWSYTAFQIIMQIVFKCHKDSILCFSVKLMDGIVSQGSVDH